MTPEIISQLHSYGLQVYMRDPSDTFAIFTNGTHLGYIENGRFGINMATVHKPGNRCGTGFMVLRDAGAFTPEHIERAFSLCPGWGHFKADHVTKYKDIEDYRAANAFNEKYRLVSASQ